MDIRTSKFSEEQIIGFLRQAEAGMPIREIGRKHGFSDASFYKWSSKYGADTVNAFKVLIAKNFMRFLLSAWVGLG